MLTSFRLDPEFRQQLKSVSFFFNMGKNFSDTIRILSGIGLQHFQKNDLTSLINVMTQQNIQFIAQKHELGATLSIDEIYFVLCCVKSLLWRKVLFSSNTSQELTDLFELVLESECFTIDYDINAIFKRIQTSEDLKTDLSMDYNRNSGEDYQSIKHKGLKIIKQMRQYNSCLENDLVSYYLEKMVNFLTCITNPFPSILKDSKTFQNIIKPYLGTLIKAAKREKAFGSDPVIHAGSFGVFLKQHNLKNMLIETSENYKIWIMIDDQLQTNASLFLNFETVNLRLNLSFYELDELLRINTLLQTSSLPAQPNGQFIKGTDVMLMIKDGVYLTFTSASYDLKDSHWQELCHLLNKVEQTFSEQLLVLRAQLGSC
ncbi:MAG: hypothetical protein ACRYGR_05645 [Janthinobacterium lividum]